MSQYNAKLFSTVILFGALWGLGWFLQRYFHIGAYKKYRQLPPGPPSSIITGTPGYARDKTHLFFDKVRKEYGDIFSVWDGPNLQIVLTSPTIVQELMTKRGSIYQNRPKLFAVHDNIFRGMSINTAEYGDAWRKQRKIFNSVSGPTGAKRFIPYQDYESKQYLKDTLDNPGAFFQNAERVGISMLITSIYGMRANDVTEPAALGLLMMGSWLEATIHPGKFVDDRWPLLQRLPHALAPWRKTYDENIKLLDTIAHAWWDPCKAAYDRGQAVDCFASGFMSKYEKEGYTETEAAIVTLGLMLAGSGTVPSQFNNLLMGCALNPSVVEKAHEELDRVVGNSRLPEPQDERNCPYIRAMIKEVMRWRPFANLGSYHATTQEDTFQGYYIPKRATVINCTYSIHHDEKRYPDHDRYEPMRFIDHHLSALEYSTQSDGLKRDHFAYGGGRRICVGMSVAETSMFILTARALWAFNVDRAVDASGNLIPIDTRNYAPGTFAKPRPFAAKLSIRSEHHAAVICREFSSATTEVRTLGEAAKAGDLGKMNELIEMMKNRPDCQVHLS